VSETRAAFGLTERLHLGRGYKYDNTIRTKFASTGNAAHAEERCILIPLSAANALKIANGAMRRTPVRGRPSVSGYGRIGMSGYGRVNMSGYGRNVLIGAVLAIGLGASLHAQTQLADPRDAQKIFATTCSACHKSPAGLAKSGQVAGFLRQHYTTGPEMSAAMAAYLVSAGSGPASKKGQAEAKAREQPGDNPAAKAKSRKQEQATAQPGERSPEAKNEGRNEARNEAKNARDQRTLRGKQLLQQAKAHDERPAAHPSPASAAEAASHQAPAAANATLAETPAAPAAGAPGAAQATPPVMTLDIPLPEMPTAPPADLTQSAFSSSPVP
jgi:hypothetical protein